MRRPLQQTKRIAEAAQKLMSVVAQSVTDTRTPEQQMRDDIIGTLKKELMITYRVDEVMAGKSAGWAVKQLYQPSMRLTPEQFMWLIDTKVKWGATIGSFHSYVRRARESMYTGYKWRDKVVPPLFDEWLSEARKH